MATEQTSDPATSSAEDDRTDERPEWAEELKTEILSAVEGMLGSARNRERQHLTQTGQSRGERAEHTAEELDRMIADAIRVNDDAKREAGERESTQSRLGALEAAAAETPPVERGRLHGLMRWGEPAK
jgi:hypothetical protein